MTAKNRTENIVQDQIIDDISNIEVNMSSQNEDNNQSENMDQNKLEELKARLKQKQAAESPVKEPKKAVKISCIGLGQGGGRLVAQLYKKQYDCLVFNTATQDLNALDIPATQKFHLDIGLNGAGKSLEIGKNAAESYAEKIKETVSVKLSDTEIFLLCFSLGGGSGSGAAETFVKILSTIGKPIIVLCILPLKSDDGAAKNNSLETLAKLAKLTQERVIQNIIVIDNEKIEAIYHNVSQLDFYDVANKAIVEPLDKMICLSSMPSSIKPLDTTELLKILLDGEGLSVYGEMTVNNYQDETAIAEAVMSNLDGNLLSSGFDINQSKYVGFYVVANKEVWGKLPAVSINYAAELLKEKAGSPTTYRGHYVVDDQEDCVKVYSIFSGLGLPSSRIETLKQEAKALEQVAKNKEVNRNLTLTLDTGKDQTTTKIDEIKNKIAQKSSPFGKFIQGTIDKRNK